MGIEWRVVPGFGGRYEVSDDGKMRSVFENGGRPRGEFLSIETKRNGYHCITLQVDKVRSKRYIHRLVWEAFCGPIPSGIDINHLNGVRADNRLSNIELATRSENMLHGMRVMGRKSNPTKGSRHWGARLSEADIPVIRELLASGTTCRAIGAQYGVSKTAIWLIETGKNWRHVP